MRVRLVAVGLWALLLGAAGCKTCEQRRSEKMSDLAQSLLRLSSAAEGVAGYGGVPSDAGGKEILDVLAKDYPDLIAPFRGYVIHAQRQGKHAVLMVCEAGDKVGLMEDAGCSAPLEKALWTASPPAPCRFSVNASAVCAAQAHAP